MLLDYVATYPNTVICYKASDMVLCVDSDASYLVILEQMICHAGQFYPLYWTSPRPVNPNPKIYSPIHKQCKTISSVVSLAAEAVPCGDFNNAKTDIGMQPDVF